MARVIEVEVTAPRDLLAGESFTVEVEVPVPEPRRRGQLAGIEIEDMDDSQLKREITNAKSVLYKAQQRGAPETTIAQNQARVDRALEEQAKRKAAEEPTEVAGEEESLEL